jgi:ankyrin repeat protein
VDVFLEAGMPARTRGPRGSALNDAMSPRGLAVAKALLAAGADPDETVDQYGTTLLHRAVDSGDPDLVQALLAARAEPGPVYRYRVSPLMSASLAGQVEMVALLIAGGADIRPRDTAGGRALSYAVLRGHLEIARALIAAGADVERDRKDVIDLARQEKNTAMEQLILEAARATPKPR